MSVGIELLGEDSKESDVAKVLHTIQSSGGVDDITTAIGIVQKIVPLHPSLSNDTNLTLLSVVSKSQLVLSQLVAYTSNLNAGNVVPSQNSLEAVYKEFIIKVLRTCSNCFYDMVCSALNSKVDRQQLKALFFGSRLYNLLSADVTIVEYLEIMNTQWQSICSKLATELGTPLQTRYLTELLTSELELSPLHASTFLFDSLFLRNNEYYHSFQQMLKYGNRIDVKRVVVNYLVPYLGSKMTPNNINCIATVLQDMQAAKYYESSSLLRINSVQLQELIVRNMPPVTANHVFRALISKFEMVREDVDENVSQVIVMLLRYAITEETKSDVSHNSEFLEGVTKRLSNTNNEVRERTMFIAKMLSGGQLKYESEFAIVIPNLNLNARVAGEVDLQQLHQDSLDSFQSVMEVTQNIGMLTFQGNDDVDSDDEDEDEDLTEIKQIVFIKDLTNMYISQGKGKTVQTVPLLKSTVQLVRQKQHLPMEVEYYASALLSSIATLNNTQEEDHFEQWRVNALVALLFIVPKDISEYFKILFNTELSIQQRISLLSSVALAARELRGLEDDQTYKPEYDFPSMRLPWDRQNDDKPTTPALETIGENAISDGTTVWKSQKLSIGKTKTTPNRFSKISAVFFYPLIHGWKNGIDLGTFDQLFKTHYIGTLRIVHNCAFPTNNYEEMTRELEEVLVEAQMQGIPLE